MIYVSKCSSYYNLFIDEVLVGYYSNDETLLGPISLKARLRLDLKEVGLESRLEECWVVVSQNGSF
jgi:hypothetical protein